MKKYLLLLCLAAALAPAQRKEPSDAEQNELRQALGEAGNSPVEFIRALEKHLQKYPATPQRASIEQALVKAALESRDDRRVLLYGEKVLARDADDPQILERVTRILLRNEDAASSERALKYAKRFEQIMRRLEGEGISDNRNRAQLADELDRTLGRALVFQARAIGNLGKTDEAIALAKQAFDQYPTAESAREMGRWLARSNRTDEAIQRYADAFVLDDSRNTATDRAKDRARLGELYTKLHNKETGLGDVMLQAYDRMAELTSRRAVEQREQDPNSTATDVMEFTLPALEGESLAMSSLKGKVVVMDFWATWCGPCRVQHPLYEKVKERFAKNQDVVFLSVNTDEDRSVVKPFLEANKWTNKVYFEGGLSEFLRVTSIPTTIVLDRDGRVVNRLNGFLPERFVDMLSDRIKDAL